MATTKSNRRRSKRRSKRRMPGRTKSGRFRKSGRRGSRRRRKNPAGTVASNPVKANRRRRRRRKNPVKSNLRGRGERRLIAGRRNRKKGRVGGYRRKGFVRGHVRRTNPVGGLMSNQGPLSRDRLMGLGIFAVSFGIGLAGASFADRAVATRASAVKDGKNALYGGNAALAILKKPDAMRLGVQFGGAVGSMVLGYVSRNVRGLPWVFAGLAGGFGANGVRMLIEGYLMPALMPAKAGEVKAGNRYYALEQGYVQDRLTAFFETPPPGSTLAASQTGEPTSPDLMGSQVAILTLGEPGPRFVADGSLGRCGECQAEGGHLSSCSEYCPNCGRTYEYDVLQGDNMLSIASLSGTDPNFVAGINGNKSLSLMKKGDTVKIPWRMGEWMREQAQKRGVDLTSDDDSRNGRVSGTNGNGHRETAPIAPPTPPEPEEFLNSSSIADPAE